MLNKQVICQGVEFNSYYLVGVHLTNTYHVSENMFTFNTKALVKGFINHTQPFFNNFNILLDEVGTELELLGNDNVKEQHDELYLIWLNMRDFLQQWNGLQGIFDDYCDDSSLDNFDSIRTQLNDFYTSCIYLMKIRKDNKFFDELSICIILEMIEGLENILWSLYEAYGYDEVWNEDFD